MWVSIRGKWRGDRLADVPIHLQFEGALLVVS